MRYHLIALSVIGLALTTSAQPPAGTDADAMKALGSDFMKAMGAVMSGGTNTASVVDFRDIKALLPTELTGLKRKSASGERSGAIGMTVAYAVADYQSDDGQYLTIKITDLGGTGGMGAIMNSWALSDIDRETDTGYERTTTLKGQKALEKYDREGKSGEIQIMAAKRFSVEISGSGVSEATLHEAVDKLDLDKLAALKPKPQTPAPAAP